jgi:hypothetical protein
MSRLYDRISAEECRPWSFKDWPNREPNGPDEILPDGAHLPVALESFDLTKLDEAFVLVGDDVVRYLEHHLDELRTFDIITNVAPPLPKMFIEFATTPRYKERNGLYSWGVSVESVDFEERGWEVEGSRWGIELQVIFEPRKGYICGPISRSFVFAAPDGTLERESPEGRASGTHRWVRCDPQWFVTDGPDKFTQEMESGLWELIVPALFTISLLHSRNVTAEPVEPPPTLSRSYRRRTGKPLSRYHVLKIEPMRKVLETTGSASSKGLGHAVHMCRGHFKRYTDEAPLFGRYTGQWWWSSQKRGNPALGEVKKDYEVRLPGFGAAYRQADEHAELATAPEARAKDPDSAGRGLRAHNATQNAMASALDDAGFTPRSPGSKEPPYDIGWQVGETVWVGEVKSLTPANEENQLRTALGQLLRYRQSLVALGFSVRMVVVAEREPTDATWGELLAAEGIALTWTAAFSEFIEGIMSGPENS